MDKTVEQATRYLEEATNPIIADNDQRFKGYVRTLARNLLKVVDDDPLRAKAVLEATARAEVAEEALAKVERELHDEKWQHSQVARSYYNLVEAHKNEIIHRQHIEKIAGDTTAREELLDRAIFNASYYLNPNQGERVEASSARVWLNTTLPSDHPNYMSYKQAVKWAPDVMAEMSKA
jgi:hypothetical protein